jgi:tetratricopeptide (TPR) repeat protein
VKLRELFNRKSVRYSLAGFACSFIAYGAYRVGTPIVKEYQSSFAAKEFKQNGVVDTYKKHFFSFVDKLDDMKSLDQENQALNRKVASLEKEIELERSAATEKEAKEITAETSKRLHTEAGSELARVLESIEYKVPTNLLPNQLYSLAVGYFRKQEYEQAAVILSSLVNLKEDSSYQKAENHLMCAIAWYKLKHFKLAQEYLTQAKYKSEATDSVYRKALVWEALTAKAEGKKQLAQDLVTSIISRYPHSEEAALVNVRDRAPAREFNHNPFERKIDSEEEQKNNEREHRVIEPAPEDAHEAHEPSAAHPEKGEKHED